MTEALALVDKGGFDPKPVVEMLTQTLFPAPIYQTYGRMIANGTIAASQSDIPEKDLGLFTKTAREVNSPTQIADMLLEIVRAQA